MVRNGDKVQDLVTGFIGIVIGMTYWLNGCVRVGVQSDGSKDGLPIDPFWVDIGQLKILEAQVLQIGGRQSTSPPGGPISKNKMPTRTPDPKQG